MDLYANTHTHACAHTHMLKNMQISTNTYATMLIYMQLCLGKHIYACTYTCIYRCAHIHKHPHIYTLQAHTHKHICHKHTKYVYSCVFVHTCTHLCTSTQTEGLTSTVVSTVPCSPGDTASLSTHLAAAQSFEVLPPRGALGHRSD